MAENSCDCNGHVAENGEIEVAYQANLKAHRQGISPSEVIKTYDAWVDYDKDLCPGVYNGPTMAANAICKIFVCSRADLRVLDIAAGTGRVGLELFKRGFRLLDALEPSRAMREHCAARGIYTNIFDEVIGDKQTSLQADQYDVVVVAGGMGEGHIPCRGFDEMARILKPGGVMCIVMREEYLSTVEEYAGKLEPYLQFLEENQVIRKISRTVMPNYSFNKNGVVYSYKAL